MLATVENNPSGATTQPKNKLIASAPLTDILLNKSLAV